MFASLLHTKNRSYFLVCRNKNAAAAAAKSEIKAKVQRAEQILEAQQKR